MLIAQHPTLFTITLLATLGWLALGCVSRVKHRHTRHLPVWLWLGEYATALLALYGLVQLGLYACP